MDRPTRPAIGRYRIRRVAGPGLDVVRALHKACFLDGYEPDHGFWWVVEYKGKPVAFAGLTKSRTTPDAGYLCRAGVVEAHRGRGLQRRLIRIRERKARALGWKTLVSDTFTNIPSSNNLIACGYTLFNPTDRWSFVGALYWRKAI